MPDQADGFRPIGPRSRVESLESRRLLSGGSFSASSLLAALTPILSQILVPLHGPNPGATASDDTGEQPIDDGAALGLPVSSVTDDPIAGAEPTVVAIVDDSTEIPADDGAIVFDDGATPPPAIDIPIDVPVDLPVDETPVVEVPVVEIPPPPFSETPIGELPPTEITPPTDLPVEPPVETPVVEVPIDVPIETPVVEVPVDETPVVVVTPVLEPTPVVTPPVTTPELPSDVGPVADAGGSGKDDFGFDDSDGKGHGNGHGHGNHNGWDKDDKGKDKDDSGNPGSNPGSEQPTEQPTTPTMPDPVVVPPSQPPVNTPTIPTTPTTPTTPSTPNTPTTVVKNPPTKSPGEKPVASENNEHSTTPASPSAPAAPAPSIADAAVTNAAVADEVHDVQVKSVAASEQNSAASVAESDDLARILSNANRFGPVAGFATTEAARRALRRQAVSVQTIREFITIDPEHPGQIATMTVNASAARTASSESAGDEQAQQQQQHQTIAAASLSRNFATESANSRSINILAAVAAGASVLAARYQRWRKRRLAEAAAARLASMLQFDPLAAWLDDDRHRRD
ncbi:MAG: hypothetical protein QOF78_2168 [Phycisphaerales bacterium]|nr:hypothetical protein [Phycisphaerales bacterium]